MTIWQFNGSLTHKFTITKLWWFTKQNGLLLLFIYECLVFSTLHCFVFLPNSAKGEIHVSFTHADQQDWKFWDWIIWIFTFYVGNITKNVIWLVCVISNCIWSISSFEFSANTTVQFGFKLQWQRQSEKWIDHVKQFIVVLISYRP
jgi:hypothetical protein